MNENAAGETAPFESTFAADYGTFQSVADLFRQISHDECVHKLESVAKIE